MTPKKRKSFLDLLIKNPRRETSRDVEIENSSDKNNEFLVTKEDSLEEKEWLTEAGEDGQLTLDVYQTDKDIVIKSTIAGVAPEDLDISYNNGMITIKGERKEEEKIEKKNYFYQELYWGGFSRSIILPTEVDQEGIEASLKNGILTVSLPKKETASQKKIRVKAV